MLKAYIVTYNYLGNNHEKLCMDRSQKRLNYKRNSLRQWNCKWKMLKRALITEAHLFPLRKQNNTFKIIFYLCLSFTRCFISGRIPSANIFAGPTAGFLKSSGKEQSTRPKPWGRAQCWLLIQLLQPDTGIQVLPPIHWFATDHKLCWMFTQQIYHLKLALLIKAHYIYKHSLDTGWVSLCGFSKKHYISKLPYYFLKNKSLGHFKTIKMCRGFKLNIRHFKYFSSFQKEQRG